MSNMQKPAQDPTFDFWEFVSCARCHLPFTPESGGPQSVPFWITECGHVVCNNHLRPNQTCAKCNAEDIQVAPLQHEMEAPMSNWFASVPHAFDTVAFATRFQFETLASLVRYYRRKYSQHRAVIERFKNDALENKELKRKIEELQSQNHQLRECVEPSDMNNRNGKRQMLDVHRHANGAHTNSSPRSVLTPVAPNRLTLPPSHQQPSFTPRAQNSDDGSGMSEHPPANRPGSSRFIEQYAYAPPTRSHNSQAHPAPLSHAQAAPIRHATSRHQMQEQPQGQAHTTMMPPPPPVGMSSRPQSGFRPAAQPHPVRRNPGLANGAKNMPPSMHQPSARHAQPPGGFRPPPSTPRDIPQAGQSFSRRFVDPRIAQNDLANESLQSNRFTSATPSLPTQRFMPPTPSGRQRFSTPAPAAGSAHSGLMRRSTDLSSRTPSRTAGSGQRMPFVPGGPNGFG